MTTEVGVPQPVGHDADDPEIRAEIGEALVATRRFGPAYEVVRQVASGSRVNFLLHVENSSTTRPAFLWCRATHRSIDDAFGARFTLAREAAIVHNLVARSFNVPRILGASVSGRVLIQDAIDEQPDPGPDARAVNIETYMAALDGVHDVPAAEIVPASEVAEGETAAQAAASEQTAWWVLAEQIASSPATVAVIERASGLDRVGARLARIHDHLINAPLPSIAPRLDFVHGDAGRANYVVDRAGTVWLIDWELAHAGSRLEDYAWIELRGLEQDEHAWRREVIARLVQLGPTSAEAYRYFRTAIYFRSVVAISARIAAEPRHSFVPYLTHRFRENEQLGWMSAGVATPNASSTGPRFDAWRRWTHSLESMTGAS